MKHLTVLSLLALVGLCASCGTSSSLQTPASSAATAATFPTSTEAPHETVLLVSLEDGSVIMQKIASSADICFKINSDSATTCLTQGAPVTSSENDAIIGFKMIEEHIDLVAKTN